MRFGTTAATAGTTAATAGKFLDLTHGCSVRLDMGEATSGLQ